MKTIFKYWCISGLILLASVSFAQQRSLQTIHSHVNDLVKKMSLVPIARMDSSKSLRLAIALPLRNQASLASLLKEIYDPTSSNYHHYLTVGQFTAQFGPTAEDYQSVIAFAKVNGLKVLDTAPNRMILDVTGTVATLEKALHMTMRNFQDPIRNRTFYAPDQEPSVNLDIPILNIAGLSDYYLTRPALRKLPVASAKSPTLNTGGTGVIPGTYMGYDFRAAYAPGVTLTGTGQTVAMVEFDGYSANDITYYESHAKPTLPNVTLTNVLIDSSDGLPDYPGVIDDEVCLDIEMAISMAPGLSQVIVYESPFDSVYTEIGWHDMLNRIATDNAAKQISCSWRNIDANGDPTGEQIFEEMDAQGQSFFEASGDDDAYTGDILFPEDSPNITQVGGTILQTTSPGGSYASETVWNWDIEYAPHDDGVGSSGGISETYTIPSWQQNVSMSNNQGSTTKRNTPDVALTADHCYVRAGSQDIGDLGGTSFAAPLWAGFTALANQEAASYGLGLVGFINPVVYTVGLSSYGSSVFHDITTWNNEWTGSPSKFSAVAGYDLCTGWGTSQGQRLLDDISFKLAVPDVYSTIASAFSAATSGQTVVVVGSTNNISGNLTAPSGVSLVIRPGATVGLNGYSIKTTGSGIITIQSGATINGLYATLLNGAGNIIGLYPSFQAALSAATSGQTVVVTSGSYNYTSNTTYPSGVSVTFNSGVTVSVNGYTLQCTGGGVFTAQSGVTINGSNVTANGSNGGLFPSIQSAIGSLSSGTIQLKSTTYTESPSFSSKSNITLNGVSQSGTHLNGSVSVTNSSNIHVWNLTLNSLSLNTNTGTDIEHITATSTTLANDYSGTSDNVQYGTENNGGASFGFTSHGASGEIGHCTIDGENAGVYLINNGSWTVESGNSFCCNGYDIYAISGASAYAAFNSQYSKKVPGNFYGNVTYDGGETSVPVCSSQCGDALSSPMIANSAVMQEPSAMQTLDQDYLALLGKIGEAESAGTYNLANYLFDYRQIIGGYEAFIKAGVDKNTIVYALCKLNLLYRGMDDVADFRTFITTNLANGSFSSLQSYFKRYLVWQ